MQSHRFWRIQYILSHATGGWNSVAEIEFRAIVGGADQCNGGVAIAKAGSSNPANAFDNNNGTSADNGGIEPHWWWIGYDFGAGNPKEVNEILIRASTFDQSPSNFVLQYSDDNVTWYNKCGYSNIPIFSNGESRTFDTSCEWDLPISIGSWKRGDWTPFLLKWTSMPGNPTSIQIRHIFDGRPDFNWLISGTDGTLVAGFSGGINATGLAGTTTRYSLNLALHTFGMHQFYVRGILASGLHLNVYGPRLQIINNLALTPHRYWRIWVEASQTLPNNVGINELELRATIGGVDQTPFAGGSAIASVTNDGDPSFAFDDNNSTYWYSWTAFPQGIGYDFGAGQTRLVKQILIRVRSSDPDAAPTQFRVQFSDNGTLWSAGWVIRNAVGWTAGQARTFEMLDLVDPPDTLSTLTHVTDGFLYKDHCESLTGWITSGTVTVDQHGFIRLGSDASYARCENFAAQSAIWSQMLLRVNGTANGGPTWRQRSSDNWCWYVQMESNKNAFLYDNRPAYNYTGISSGVDSHTPGTLDIIHVHAKDDLVRYRFPTTGKSASLVSNVMNGISGIIGIWRNNQGAVDLDGVLVGKCDDDGFARVKVTDLPAGYKARLGTLVVEELGGIASIDVWDTPLIFPIATIDVLDDTNNVVASGAGVAGVDRPAGVIPGDVYSYSAAGSSVTTTNNITDITSITDI